jgi:hypothetical protein
MEERQLFLDIFQQCHKYLHLVKNNDEIMNRILNVYYREDNSLFDRIQTLYALSYVADLGKDRLDLIYAARESLQGSDRRERRASIILLDRILHKNSFSYLHFEFILQMLMKFQSDISITISLIHLLRHMTYGPSVLMQVSTYSINQKVSFTITLSYFKARWVLSSLIESTQNYIIFLNALSVLQFLVIRSRFEMDQHVSLFKRITSQRCTKFL